MSRQEASDWLSCMAVENMGAIHAEGRWWFKDDLRQAREGRETPAPEVPGQRWRSRKGGAR